MAVPQNVALQFINPQHSFRGVGAHSERDGDCLGTGARIKLESALHDSFLCPKLGRVSSDDKRCLAAYLVCDRFAVHDPRCHEPCAIEIVFRHLTLGRSKLDSK
ncbi:MAG: hypothetical protein JWM68_297 [Verrucomicrobiales bacterium]|nr:hypothetical protein [Verrucomicrobiales bacterium]